MLLAITVPITMASALFAEEIVQTLLGGSGARRSDRPSADSHRIVLAMINPFAWSPFATGSLRMAFVIAPAVILGILCGLPWGPKGVVTGYSVATGSLLPILIVWAIHGRGITVGDYWRSARKPLMAGLLATVCGPAISQAGA